MYRLNLLLRLALVACLPASLGAQTLSGRLTSSFYAYERSDSSAFTSNDVRAYQAFQFDFAGKNFVVRTYGQLDRDFDSKLAGDGKARLYNFYLDWKNLGQRVDVQIGRQPIFGGVAVGAIDGAQIKVRAAHWLRLKAFGGGLLPSDRRIKLTDDFDKNFMAGGQASLKPNDDWNVSVSFFEKRQLRPGYETLRADSIGNVFTQFVEPSDRAYRLGAVDASWYASAKTSFYGRSDYDFHAEQITRAELSLRSEVSSQTVLNGSYTFRSPRLPWNSIFAAFNVEDNHEVEGGVYYQHKPSLRFYGNAAGIFYSGGDNSLRFTVGTDVKYGGLNFVHRTGYAGSLDGINASCYYPTHDGKLMPSLQLSWATYKLDSEQSERESLYSGAAGVLVRPVKTVTIDGQLQLLRNRYYSNDVRFLLRLQYWFFNKLGAAI